MIAASVDEAARQFGVTAKTIREWIRHGLPTHKEGGKGPNQGAIVDMARAADWVSRYRHETSVGRPADFFNEMPPSLRNPFRAVVERFFDMSVQALGVAAVGWFKDPKTNGKLAWQELGLTEEQARAMVWQMWGLSSLFLLAGKREQFDQKWVAGLVKGFDVDGAADLDDLASLFLCGDFRTNWKDEIRVPDCIQPFAPKHLKGKAGEKHANRD